MHTWALHTARCLSLTVGLTGICHGQDYREVGRTTEKELKVVLSSSFGALRLSRGEEGKIVATQRRDDSPLSYSLQYSVRNRIGYLDLALGEEEKDNESEKKSSFHFTGFKGGDYSVQFTDALPISFDIEMGVGKGAFDFSGLQVKDLNLSTGASDVTVSFDEPNSAMLENINIEAGVSKFVGRSLCNANFRRFRFQGGVGTCTLDFGGSLTRAVDVDVQVGMGIMTIIIPSEDGAKVTYENSWISKVEAYDDFESRGEGEYVSKNYGTARGTMDIRVESGVGSVRIKRSE
jgi:hypothetical protein